MKKKIAIIGHFGGNENFLDGQTVKTKILYDELKNATDWQIIKVDTYYKQKNPVGLLIKTLSTLLTTKDIIVLLSGNGMKFYFPLLHYASKLLGIRVYHDVIGGNLDNYVRKYPSFKKYLNGFKINWVETGGLKRKLGEVDIKNCEVIPNFKRLNIIPSSAITTGTTEESVYKFCTFSRVMKEKGIEVAIDAIEAINEENGSIICKLDIYGPIDERYQEEFDAKLKYCSRAISYCGKVSYDKSAEVLNRYYALLFPTYWDGEGFPGTIVDAFSAGLSVIATDWNCNAEIITDGEDGIIYPSSRFNNLEQAIKWAIENDGAIMEMKKNSLVKAQEFCPEKYIDMIVNCIKNS